MATFTFEFGDTKITSEIPDEVMAVTVDAVAATYGYRDEIPDTTPEGRRQRLTIPNPQTPAQFMIAHLVGHLNQITRDYASQQAVEEARKNVQAPQIEARA